MEGDILRQQLEYYRARAHEYDESIQQIGRFAGDEKTPAAEAELAAITAALHRLTPGKHVLELACGTGIWTRELLPISDALTALDGAPEMLDVNRAKIADPRVRYECVDLFTWEPGRPFDLVFFAFWVSHVPHERLAAFLDRVTRATRVGGQVFIVDEPGGGQQISGANENERTQQRQLLDGRIYEIIKVYYDPAVLQAELARRGFAEFELLRGDYFFSLCATRQS